MHALVPGELGERRRVRPGVQRRDVQLRRRRLRADAVRVHCAALEVVVRARRPLDCTRAPRTTRRLSPPASLPPCRRRFDLGAFDAHALELPLATLAPHLASNPALAGKDGRVSLRVCTQTDLATLCEGADTPATLRGAAAALSFVAPGARCVTQSLGALKDKRVGLIARAHGDTTTPAGVNLSFYNGSACGNERSPRIERGGRMIRASVHFVLMCEPSVRRSSTHFRAIPAAIPAQLRRDSGAIPARSCAIL